MLYYHQQHQGVGGGGGLFQHWPKWPRRWSLSSKPPPSRGLIAAEGAAAAAAAAQPCSPPGSPPGSRGVLWWPGVSSGQQHAAREFMQVL